jgi:Putative transmembrane protein (PGPGW)
MDQNPPDLEPPATTEAQAGEPTNRGPESTEPTGLASSLPKELGVMLVSAGVIGVVLPGPGAPALVAGGLILWPEAFGKAERWFRKRFPQTHRQGMGHVNRFLTDLERRYPGSTRPRPEKPEPEHP